MKKRIILIMCMLGTIGLSYANNYDDKLTIIGRTESGDEKINAAASISASINGHSLTVAFTQNIGEVSIDISTASGATVICLSVPTPTGYQYHIPTTGSYVITFTLPNGDEYYGEFEVME